MKVTEVKIIKDSSQAMLQRNANTYMTNIIRLGATVIGKPQFKVIKLDPKWLDNYIKTAIIKDFNQHHEILGFKPNTKLSEIGKGAPKLAALIRNTVENAVPLEFYVLISYKVPQNILDAHTEVFD